jgi:inhibitor of KinA sporulation pathway (predicted exonuclease)
MECKRWSLYPPSIYHKVINVKFVFEKICKTKKLGMDGMLDHCGLTLVGRHHSGIDDCNNIAQLVKYFHINGANWKKFVSKINKKDYEINKGKKLASKNTEMVLQRQKERTELKNEIK